MKLNQFMRMIETGVMRYLPKLSKFFLDESSLVGLVITQWIITLFTMDFSIELAFCITDMFLVFGWKAIYGSILSILAYLQESLVNIHEEDAIVLIKKFIKEGNIDFDSFFQNMLKFRLSEIDMKQLGKKIYSASLPIKIVSILSSQSSEINIFSTYEVPSASIEKINSHQNPENFITLNDEIKKPEESPKFRKRNKNRIPRRFENKRDKIRLSSANHYKPLENIRSPLPIQVTSDEEEDVRSVEMLPYTEEGKFMIPNEGNINKSPMFLLNKDNKVTI